MKLTARGQRVVLVLVLTGLVGLVAIIGFLPPMWWR